MPDSQQRLGIEIDLTLSGSFNDIIKRIEVAFASIDLSKVTKQIEAVEKATAQVGKTGLDFSKLSNAQWKLLEEGAAGASISISKADTNLADLNKTLAKVANNEKEWATIAQDANGKYISGIKAAANEAKKAAEEKIRAEKALSAEKLKQSQIDAAYNIRRRQLGSTAGNKSTTTDLAYAQYREQNGISEKVIANTTEAAYRARESQLKELSKVNSEKARLYAADEKAEQRHLQKIEQMVEKEESISTRLKNAWYTSLGNNYMKSYTQQGMTPVNGGWARTSAVNMSKRSSIDDLQVQANSSNDYYKLNSSKIREYDDWLKGLRKQGMALWGDQVIPIKEYNQMLGKTNSLFDIFGSSVGKVIKHLTEFYAIRGAIFAVTGEIKNSIGAIVEYRQTVSEIAAITTATKEQTHEYEQTISQLARTSKFSAVEIASAMKTVAQQGVQARDLASVTRSSEQLAAAVGGDPTASAHIITNTMNIWKLGANEAKDVANTMAAAMKNSALTVEGLSTAFNYLGAQAKASNMSLQETTSVIAVLKKQGMQDSTIGTGLSQFLKILTAPTPKVRKLWKELGIDNLDQVNPKLRTFSDIINTITTKGVQKFGSEFALTDKVLAAFEMRTGRNLVSALVAGSDAFKAMHLSMQYSQAGAIALERTMEGPQVKINKLRHEFMLFTQEIVDSLSPAIGVVYESMMKLVIGIQSAQARTELLIVSLGGLLVAIVGIGDKLLKLAETNPVITALSIAVTALGAAFVLTAGYTDTASESYKKWLKTYKDSADSTQREINLMNQLIGSIKNVNGHKAAYNDLNESQKKVIDELAKSHPGLIEQMKAENDVRKTGIEFLEREVDLRFQLQLQAAKQYNDAYNTSQRAKKTIADVDKNSSTLNDIASAPGNLVDDLGFELTKSVAKMLGRPTPKRNAMVGSDSHAIRRNADDELQTANKIMRDNEGYATSIPRRADGTFITDVKRKDLEGKDAKAPSDYTNLNNAAPTDKKQQERQQALQEKVDKKLGESFLDSQVELARAQLSLDKQRLETAKLSLATDADLQKYKTESAKIVEEELALERGRITLETNKKAAADVNGTIHYNDDGTIHGIIPGKGFSVEDAKAAVARRSAAASPLYEAASQKAINAKSNINDTVLTVPKDHIENSLNEEKRINRRIQLLREDTAVRKDLAATGEEEYSSEMDGMTKEIELIGERTEALNREIQTRKAWMNSPEYKDIAKSDQKINEDRINALQEQVEDNERLRADRIRQMDKNANPWGTIKDGVSSANKQAYNNAGWDKVGQEIATTGYNGLVSVIDTSLNKLEQLKWSWKDFGKSFGNIMQDVAAQIQKGIIKMMVLAAWQKITGLLTSWGGSPMAPTSTTSYTGGVDGLSPGGVGGLSTIPGLEGMGGMATGGLVTGGVPNKDSVPAYLMPGEIVINKSAVDRYGAHNLLAVNAQKFASGGLVGGLSSGPSGGQDAKNLTIINVADASSIPPSTPSETQVVNIVSFALQKNATFRQQIKLAANS